jgi:hypothetical protein
VPLRQLLRRAHPGAGRDLRTEGRPVSRRLQQRLGVAREATAHGRERGFSFPIVKDEGHAIADAIGATHTPEAFVVDGSGRLRYRGRVMSKQESPELRRALEAVLDGRPVRTPVTKAFGCAIGGS